MRFNPALASCHCETAVKVRYASLLCHPEISAKRPPLAAQRSSITSFQTMCHIVFTQGSDAASLCNMWPILTNISYCRNRGIGNDATVSHDVADVSSEYG